MLVVIREHLRAAGTMLVATRVLATHTSLPRTCLTPSAPVELQ